MHDKKSAPHHKPSFFKEHYKPRGCGDWFAYGIVQVLKFPMDQFFQKRYAHRAMIIETVAAVPGMLGGALLQYKCLRAFIDDKGWIESLVEESQNERMHLTTFLAIARPHWYERVMIYGMQGFMFVFYGILYRISPRIAHRFVGYTEESAIYSYTQYLDALKKGDIPNYPAPPIAVAYWELSDDATLIEVIEAIRLDECRHRDTNHEYATLLLKNEGPAPMKRK